MGLITGSFKTSREFVDVFSREKPGTIYARYFYREEQEFEEKLAAYCGAKDAALFNSGMAAITTVVRSLGIKQGDKVVVSDCLYSKTIEFFEDLRRKEGVRVNFFNPTSEVFYQAAANPDTKLIFTEVIGNGFEMPVTDLTRLMEGVKGHKTTLMIDNTFLTPALLKVMVLAGSHGVPDQVVVVESGTKYYQLGADEVTLGLAYGQKEIIGQVKEARVTLGTYLQPRCLEAIPADIFVSLERTIRAHSVNAMQLMSFLYKYGLAVDQIHYPHSMTRFDVGGVLYFSLKGGPEAVETFCDSLQKCKIGGSFGHPETWVLPLGMLRGNGIVRVAVGWQQPIEEVISDFRQAL